MAQYEKIGINILLGKIIKKIDINIDEIYFHISETEIYKMHHEQDCCESVIIEDICGEISWLLDSPILRAEERSNSGDATKTEDFPESFTWTFYELGSLNGSVTIRWYGTSNGYYSESVNFERVE
jgi:hypothetical protein